MKKIFNIYTIILTIALTNVCTDIRGQTASQNQYNIGIPVLTNIWVDPLHGNDSNSGATRSQSIKSLKEAWNRIPSETTLNTTGYNIMLTSGNYSEDLLPGNGWMESRYGTYQFPIIIQSADGSLAAHLHGYLNFFNCRYIYLIGLDFVTDPGYGNGGNVIHLADCNHILIRDCKLNGFDGTENQPQETLKANQAQYLYIENSDISGAFWFPLDFVAVQYGHIIDSRIHNAGDWCMVLKGGSAYFTIERNEIYNGVTGGFTAGQGTGFEFMVPPWLHYEAYDIKFINNIIHDTDGAGIGVNGGYNILFAYNTLYRVGKRSHTIEVVFGLRGCDGNTSKSKQYLSLGGWGTQITGREEPIPNRNIYIYNNIVYNPSGYQSQWSHFAIYGPRTPSQGTNIPSPAVTDANLRIRGNVIWNGPVNHPLGIEESDQGAQPSNPTCNETLLEAENSINTIKPQILDPDNNNFKPAPNGNISTVTSYKIPDFPNNDRPQPPLSPNSSLNNTVTYDFDGNLRTSSNPPGAYANELTIKSIPSLSEILSACEFLNDGDIPLDTFSPPQNALYVATAALGGNDNNNGASINSPLEHLDKAIEYANNHPNTPLTIYLRGGTYYYKTYDLYQTIDRGNLYITSYQNEDVTIRPPCWPNNPSSWFDERAFQINGPYENITFDNLKFEGWEIIFNPGASLNTLPLRNLTIKNITASNFTHRYGDTNFLRTFLETAYLLDNVYGPGKEIFNNPDSAKYQIEGLILKNITITDADMAINIGDENDANVKGMRITQVKLENPPQQGGDSSSDAFAIVNSYKILIDHCDIENVCDDGIDTKSYNVSVVNSFITGTGRNAVKFWRNGEIINSIIYNCTAINDGALIVEEGPCRVINSILMKKSVGYAGTFNYDGTSSAKFEIVNSIFIDLDHTFYVGTGNLQSKNCLYYDIPVGIFSGQVSANSIQSLNNLSNCSGNISSNPLFINPENKDFRTTVNSPCIDKGTSAGITLPSFDYNGNSRIAGNSPDIGPFEYNSSPPSENPPVLKDWPCGSGTLIGNANNLGSGYEPSGIIWHSRLNRLVTISDEGDITTMDTNGNNITTWHVGGDIEAVTIADPNSQYVYVGIENPDAIKEFNIETGQLTGKSWDLTTWMTGPANSGLEALTFIPNGKHPYSYSASGGLFYAGLQYNGKIYVFDVDLSVNGKASYIDTITPLEGTTDISDLYYNIETDILYAIFDSGNLLVEMDTNGNVIKEYKLPGNEQEGITVIPLTPLSIAQIYIAEDTPPKIWKYNNYPLRTVTLTINSNSGGTTNPAPGLYDYDGGTTVTISANPITGYIFSQWSGAYTGNTNPITITMDTDKTVTANFSMIPSSPPSPSMPNLATSSTVTTSSEYSAEYNSLKTIDGIKGIWDQGEWASKGEMTPWIKFRWNNPQLINKVIFYDRSNPIDHIKDAWMYLNKYGQRISSIHLGMFPYGGSAKEVVFDAVEADEITIVITDGVGLNIGLSEFMAYYDTNIPDTDNLAMQCSVTASSYYNETYRPELTVDSKYGLWDEYEWTSRGEMTPWIKFRWNSPQLINKVILYDRSNPIDHIKDAWLYLNKYGQRVNSIHLGMFPYGGSAKEVVFDAVEADEITIVITDGVGLNIGLSEFMAYYDTNIPNTDNLAMQCSVTASSYYNENYRPELAVDSKYGLWDEYEWTSKGEMTPWIKFRWNSPQLINKVILYDRSNPIDHIKDAWLYLNKYGQRVNSIHLGMFPYGGSAKEVVFDPVETDEITIVITDGIGINIGLSEFMAYHE